jgi:hypothetical protein
MVLTTQNFETQDGREGERVRGQTRVGSVQSVSPTGGMVAPNGDLYILEASVLNEVRLKRIGRDGSVRYL